MRSVEARIRSEIERAVTMISDRHVQGTTEKQSREYIARLRTTAGALAHEAADIFALSDEVEAMLSPPAKRRRR